MAVVSVGVPVFNGEAYLQQTLDSLLAQTLTDFEIVISDNASTDRTPEICRSYEKMDRRVRYFRNDRNIGAAPNFNRVVELADAPLVHCGASDDLYDPRFLERCVDVLGRDPGLVLSYTQTTMIDEQGAPLLFDRGRNCFLDSHGDFLMTPVPPYVATSASPERRFRDVLWPMGWCLPLSGVIRKDALLRTSLYRNYYGADKVLLAELALQGRFHQVLEDLFAKRVHRGATHYKSTRERAKHESKAASLLPPQAQMLRDYTRMTWGADLRPRQRLHCMLTIAGIARRPDVWRKLLLPGRDNYWGLSFAAK